MQTNYPYLPFRKFGFAYEDLPAFHAAYFMLVLIFAGIFNLGLFAVLIVIHILLDFTKYHLYLCNRRVSSVVAVFRENIGDLAFFFLALTSLVYLNPTLPHIAILTGTRLTDVVLARGLAILLAKLMILHHSLRIAFNLPQYMHTPYERLRMNWSITECIYLSTLFLALCFLAVAPGVLGIDLHQFKDILVGQLIPWKL